MAEEMVRFKHKVASVSVSLAGSKTTEPGEITEMALSAAQRLQDHDRGTIIREPRAAGK